MKKFNRLFTLMLALMLVISLAVPAMADDDVPANPPSTLSTTYTITVEGSNANHTYEAYQIFTGDIASTTLSNIHWGDGISEAGQNAVYDEYKVSSPGAVAEKLSTTDDAKAFAEFIARYLVKENAHTGSFAGGYHTIGDLPAGYYFIKDKDGSLENAASTSYTSYILHLVNDIIVKPKSTSPTLTKTVSDINDSDMNTQENFLESADHDINDPVPFRLNVTLGNIDSYGTYKLKIVDELSKGLTYQNDHLRQHKAGGRNPLYGHY